MKAHSNILETTTACNIGVVTNVVVPGSLQAPCLHNNEGAFYLPLWRTPKLWSPPGGCWRRCRCNCPRHCGWLWRSEVGRFSGPRGVEGLLRLQGATEDRGHQKQMNLSSSSLILQLQYKQLMTLIWSDMTAFQASFTIYIRLKASPYSSVKKTSTLRKLRQAWGSNSLLVSLSA